MREIELAGFPFVFVNAKATAIAATAILQRGRSPVTIPYTYKLQHNNIIVTYNERIAQKMYAFLDN
jgi:hypothetical protein